MKLSGADIQGIPWFVDDPQRHTLELNAMRAAAPELTWHDTIGAAGGWEGLLPLWPFERPLPHALEPFTLPQFHVEMQCRQSHPAVPPLVFPRDPIPSLDHRTVHDWHLNGDGSLCLLRAADLWDHRSMSLELVIKASAWFLEYLLMDAGVIGAMTENGIATSDELDDPLIKHFKTQNRPR